MTLMRAKGITETDFASNHPGGQLGKRLTLLVGDLMHAGAENPMREREMRLKAVARAVVQTASAITNGGAITATGAATASVSSGTAIATAGNVDVERDTGRSGNTLRTARYKGR